MKAVKKTMNNLPIKINIPPIPCTIANNAGLLWDEKIYQVWIKSSKIYVSIITTTLLNSGNILSASLLFSPLLPLPILPFSRRKKNTQLKKKN